MSQPIQATNYTFRNIREAGFVYVDKTQYLYDLVRYPLGTYFVSRPRRFGKSLAVSTLAEIFNGSKELFEGLWIYNSDYQWDSFPIIHIDFGLIDSANATELKTNLQQLLGEIASQYDLTIKSNDHLELFRNLVYQLADKHNGKVVLLIDEYDKPIVNNLDDVERAKQIRDALRGFYGVVKALNRYWRFVFITGISRFSRVGVFSTMNNLDDLTMDYRLADAFGLTEKELRHNFGPHLEEFAEQKQLPFEELMDRIRTWYDGFRFAPEGESLYNPYSTIQLLLSRQFSYYWFSTGTPYFLIKLLQQKEYDIRSLDRVEADELLLQTYDLENLSIIPLLYQTGYLTIKDFEEDEFGLSYTLSYPNQEVRHSFVTYLLNAYTDNNGMPTDSHLRQLIRTLRAKDLKQFFQVLNIFFANIDYDLHLKNEKYYQTIFYMIFLLLGLKIAAEMKTNQGRIDAVIELEKDIFIFEFKLDSKASTALQQTKDKAYAEKYRLRGKNITLVGTNFDYKQRKVTEWESEPDQPF